MSGTQTIPAVTLTCAGHEISYAGECPWNRGLCVGTETGRIQLWSLQERSDGELIAPAQPEIGTDLCWDLVELTEPINGIAFSGDLMGVSTRSEVVVYRRDPSSRHLDRVGDPYEGGAHGIVATPTGDFLAPLGNEGLLSIGVGPGETLRTAIGRVPDRDLNFYKVAHLGGNAFACAARHDGLLGLSLDPRANQFHLTVYDSPHLDIVDLCHLEACDLDLNHKHAVAGLTRDGRVLLSRDVFRKKPEIVRYPGLVRGTPYAILSGSGHLIILSSDMLAVVAQEVTRLFADDVSRMLDNEAMRVFGGVQCSGRMAELQASDAFMAYNKYLLVLVDGSLRIIRANVFALEARGLDRSQGWSLDLPSSRWGGNPESLRDACVTVRHYDLILESTA